MKTRVLSASEKSPMPSLRTHKSSNIGIWVRIVLVALNPEDLCSDARYESGSSD